MSADRPGDRAALTPPVEDIDDVCDRFEAAWKAALAGGSRPCIEDALDLVSPAERPTLLHELVLLDLHYRGRAGEAVNPEVYRGRFPTLDEERLAGQVRIQERTWMKGRTASPTTPIPPAGRRRCPHCRNPLRVADGQNDEVLCPGCGSTFRVRDAHTTHSADPTRPLGKFELLERVGAGGCGAVWKARDTELHRTVALKIPHTGPLTEAAKLERFQREARAAAQLRHPGIVSVHEVATLDGLPVLVADFVTGVSLKDLLEARGLTFREAAALLAEVAEAVHYAHRMGVIHRDLKPTNVMIAYDETDEVGLGSGKGLGVGRPLVMDFGLALWQDAGVTLTSEGDVVGTPAYMSPEQASGQAHWADARSDVYSLGVILYEMLCGELPFRGSMTMLLLQVRREEPRPPRKLNDKVPRDLETICLKCLEKDPRRRYASARDLAEDLRRWLASEPIRARPVGRLERSWKWVRRNPATAGLLAAVLVVVLAAGTGVWWLGRQRAERREAVEAALGEMGRLQERSRWEEARSILAQARLRLGDGGPGDLRARLDHAEAALNLVARLDDIRLKRVTWREGHFDREGADRGYEKAFRDAGMGEVGSDTEAAAAWVRDTGVGPAVVGALDDWALCAPERERWSWLLEVARRADPDLWRDRVRDPGVWADADALARLAAQGQVAAQSPRLLVQLSARMHRLQGDAERVLRAAQRRYPGDFWVNFELAGLLHEQKNLGEAVGFYRAALALRPGTFAVHNNLGNVLSDQGQLEEAADHYRQASELNPSDAWPHNHIGHVLRVQGKLDEAAAAYRRAIALDPRFAKAYHGLGNVLQAQGKEDEAIAAYRQAVAFDDRLAGTYYNLGALLSNRGKVNEAIAAYRRVIALDDTFAEAHNNLGDALCSQGKVDEAAREFRRAIALNPNLPQPHNQLAYILHNQGKVDEAITHYRKVIEIDPTIPRVHYNLANAFSTQGKVGEAVAAYRRAIENDPQCAQAHNNLGGLLHSQGKVDEAVAEYRKALAIDSNLVQAHCNLGLALRSQGKADEAIGEFRKTIELDPRKVQAHQNLGEMFTSQEKWEEAAAAYRRVIALEPQYAVGHGALGQALLKQGEFTEARQATRRCLELLPAQHNLRLFVSEQMRQCEQILALDTKLSAILAGKEKAADAAEQVRLAGLCVLRKRPAAAARFFTDAFAAHPALADDLKAGHRYNAACAAVLAAAGQGQDATDLDAGERSRLRRLALDWLRADLALWSKQGSGPAPQKTAMQQALGNWQKDANLAGLRDAAALEKLPQAERGEWEKLWSEVEALRKKAGEEGKKQP
jgi:tetratricopeptide (TPR) repeat protein/tRNA A-37 threonylcarbamoyl transferase component Bud32